MDVNYNYDELWLIRAVLQRGAGRVQWVQDAHDLGRWFADRDATLPPGSLTAHHVDSHDTFWWPQPGGKWRREQYGTAATAAMMSVFTLSGGPFMTFVGGEVGIEDEVRAVHRVRREHPVFAAGRSDHASVRSDDRYVYAVLRSDGPVAGLAVVNLQDDHTITRIEIDTNALEGTPPAVTQDLLGEGSVSWQQEGAVTAATLTLRPFQALALLLTKRSG